MHAPAGHICTCTEYRVLKSASDNYWKSYAGIIRRIDGLAQDLHYKTANNAFIMVAPANDVLWLHWVTAEDDRVCPICQRYGAGGKEGYYRISWFMPKLPVHRWDRCQIELVFFNPVFFNPFE